VQALIGIAEQIASHLIVRKQTVSVAESSTGGLISTSLLAVRGASAYFLGSAVAYTRVTRRILMDIPDAEMKGIRSASEPRKLLANQIRSRFASDWRLSETGATGPTGNRYGDAAGDSCISVAGGRVYGDRTGNRQSRPGRQYARLRKRGAKRITSASLALKITSQAPRTPAS
jgi:PncC family amidohydrolase